MAVVSITPSEGEFQEGFEQRHGQTRYGGSAQPSYEVRVLVLNDVSSNHRDVLP